MSDDPMTQAELNALPLGLYRVFWQCGGSSLASVGMDYEGKRWIAPTNWTAKEVKGPAALLADTGWSAAHRLERIHVPDPDDEQEEDRAAECRKAEADTLRRIVLDALVLLEDEGDERMLDPMIRREALIARMRVALGVA